MDVVSYALSKLYTDKEIAGGGAIKGKNCTIESVTEVTGGKNIVFKWYLDDGTEQTTTVFVPQGDKGDNGLNSGIESTTPITPSEQHPGGGTKIVFFYYDAQDTKQTVEVDVYNGLVGHSVSVATQTITGGNRVTFTWFDELTQQEQSTHIDVLDGHLSESNAINNVTALPVASADNEGFVYFRITDNTLWKCVEVLPATDPKTYDYEEVKLGGDMPEGVIECVDTLPTAASEDVNKVVFLQSNNSLYKCQADGQGGYAYTRLWAAIDDDSITNAKLATDVKVGSLANLTTTEKSSVVGAIIELDDKKVDETRTIATLTLEQDITAAQLADKLKDETVTLTNKTIDADDNTIQDLTVSNIKAGKVTTGATADNDIFATKGYADDTFVPKTRTIAGVDLQDNVTATEVANAIKDETVTLTNKTIDADDNTIQDLSPVNVKAEKFETTGTLAGDKFAGKSYVDSEIEKVVGKTFTFKGYISSTAPANAKAGDLWYEGSALPTTFPINVKTFDGTAWSSTTTEYTPVDFDTWSFGEHGYYWFANDWNILDTDLNPVDDVTIDRNNQGELEVKDGGVTNAKLGSDVKVGSLASLTTTEKASVTGAINEVKADTAVDNVTVERSNNAIQVKAGGIDTAQLADGAVTTAKIDTGAVTTQKLADGSVTTAKLDTGAVTTEKLADGAVTTAKIDANAVTKAKLNNDVVDDNTLELDGTNGLQVKDDGITNAKLGLDIKVGSLSSLRTPDTQSVTAALNSVYNGTIRKVDRLPVASSSSLGDVVFLQTDNSIYKCIQNAQGYYLYSKLYPEVANDSITNAKLGTDVKVGSLAALTTTEKASVVGAINEVKADTAVDDTTVERANDVIQIKDGGVTTGKLADSSVITAKINANAVTKAKLNSDVVDNSTLELDSTNGLQMKDGGTSWAKLNADLQARIPAIVDTIPVSNLRTDCLYRRTDTWWTLNGERFDTSLIYNAYKFATDDYHADATGVYEGNDLYATWDDINADPVAWWANMVANSYAEETTIDDGDCVAVTWFNGSGYISTWYGNFTLQSRVNLYQVINGQLEIVTPRLAIDDIAIEEDSTHMSLGLVGEADLHTGTDGVPKQTGVDIFLGGGSNPDPDIIQDGQAYRYSNTKTSSNNYINTALDNIRSMAEGSNKTYFIAYPGTLPSAGSRNLNAYYYVQQGSASGTNYQRWFIDSTDVAHDLGTTQIDISTFVLKTDVVVPNSSSTEGQAADAKGVYDNFAPMNSINAIQYAIIHVDQAVFNFTNQDTGTGYRQYEQKMYSIGQMTDPITNETVYGPLRVEQSVVLTYQVRITQTITSDFHNSGAGMEGKTQKVFRRVGVLTSTSDNTFLLNPYTNRTSIVWGEWYPIEYPNVAIALDTTKVASVSKCDMAITGGIAHIRFNNLSFLSATGSSAVQFNASTATELQIISRNKFRGASTAANYVWAPLISVNGKHAMVCGNGNLYVWAADANTGYYGEIVIPLGY